MSWLGIECNANGKVSMITLSNFNLSGTLSPSVAKLDSLVGIRLSGNKISGVIPSNWTSLRSLTLLDISNNNISSPLPNFSKSLKLLIDGNPLSNHGSTAPEASPSSSPGKSPPSSRKAEPSLHTPSPASNSNSGSKNSEREENFIVMIAKIAGAATGVFIAILINVYCFRKRKDNSNGPSTLVIHPRDVSNSENVVKIVVPNNKNGNISTVTDNDSGSVNSSGNGEPHVIEAGNLVISVEVLRNWTKNFAAENELGLFLDCFP
ncbi:hypothetical protein RIF29_00384 [Crotalaria pallida]|uniref:Uncharacterized protein n=1 Tax=Crotalaria pallida TaxID=3830 RepID=A0AAN9IWL1_CROPI